MEALKKILNMTSNNEKIKQYIKDLEEWNLNRKHISEKNRLLIKHWHSIPWWRWWERVPFEDQKRVILHNWSKMPPPPTYPSIYLPPETASGFST